MIAIVYTCLALLAFAGNSLLCRLALRADEIDPASFTSIRLAAGALTLLLVFSLRRGSSSLRASGSWLSAAMLFLYAICFSYAYVTLSAGAGALILFAAVQGTMITIGLWSGDRPAPIEWLGWLLAFIGMGWLLLPGVEAPPIAGATLMILAGVAWGVYSVRGRSEKDSLAATTSNFALTLPMILVLTLLTAATAGMSLRGIVIASISGSLTSGLGYVAWYAALEHLSAMRAALVQLSVPAIAAAGGVMLLAEPLSGRLLVSSALVLGGICLALSCRRGQS